MSTMPLPLHGRTILVVHGDSHHMPKAVTLVTNPDGTTSSPQATFTPDEGLHTLLFGTVGEPGWHERKVYVITSAVRTHPLLVQKRGSFYGRHMGEDVMRNLFAEEPLESLDLESITGDRPWPLLKGQCPNWSNYGGGDMLACLSGMQEEMRTRGELR